MVKLNLLDSSRLADHYLFSEYHGPNLVDLDITVNAPDFQLPLQIQDLIKEERVLSKTQIGIDVKDIGLQNDFEPRGEDFLKSRKELIEHVMKRT